MPTMTKEELLKTHKDFSIMAPKWRFWEAAHEGPEALVEYGVLRQYATEDDRGYAIRKDEADGFGYSSSILSLYTELLHSKDPARDYGRFGSDPLFELFLDDCNQLNSNFHVFLKEWAKQAAIYGHVGILVDKPSQEGVLTRQQAIDDKVYPYLSAYAPPAILDWKYGKDVHRRPVLEMVKLREDDGAILLYGRSIWQRWRIEDEQGRAMAQPLLDGEGLNPLGVVPFVWLTNRRRLDKFPHRLPLGDSDLKVVARLDAGILRASSLCDEVAKNAAFPMFRRPAELGPDPESGESYQPTGPQAVLPVEVRDGVLLKPDWLESAAKDPIEAIMGVMAMKTAELYRTANVGGLQVTENSGEAKSGVALRHEFQLLNSVLSAKAVSLEEAELTILYFWALWQDMPDAYSTVTVEWPQSFEVEDLAADLEVLMGMAMAVPGSATFQKHVQMSVASRLDRAADDLPTIEQEIEAGEIQKAAQRERLSQMDGALDALNDNGAGDEGGADDGDQ